MGGYEDFVQAWALGLGKGCFPSMSPKTDCDCLYDEVKAGAYTECPIIVASP